MPLEKFFSGEQPINVKDLTIENPEKEEEPWFDPEKEMTEEDWKGVRQHLKTRAFPDDVAATVMLMQAYPGRAEQFGAEAMTKELRDRGEHAFKEMKLLYGMKILTPELFREFGTPERIERYRRTSLESLQSGATVGAEILIAQELLGSRIVGIGGSPEKIWRATKKEADRERTSRTWSGFISCAARLRLLFPKRFSELGIDREAWRGMKEYFQDMKKCLQEQRKACTDPQMPFFFPDLLAELRILAAEEIKLKEDGGFEVIMRKPKSELEPETPPLPEKKNF